MTYDKRRSNVSMEGNKRSIKKPLSLWSIDFNKGAKTVQWGKSSHFNQ